MKNYYSWKKEAVWQGEYLGTPFSIDAKGEENIGRERIFLSMKKAEIINQGCHWCPYGIGRDEKYSWDAKWWCPLRKMLSHSWRSAKYQVPIMYLDNIEALDDLYGLPWWITTLDEGLDDALWWSWWWCEAITSNVLTYDDLNDGRLHYNMMLHIIDDISLHYLNDMVNWWHWRWRYEPIMKKCDGAE